MLLKPSVPDGGASCRTYASDSEWTRPNMRLTPTSNDQDHNSHSTSEPAQCDRNASF